jgi:hypothetical protein
MALYHGSQPVNGKRCQQVPKHLFDSARFARLFLCTCISVEYFHRTPKTVRSITIAPRRYRDRETGEWKDARSFRASDLTALIVFPKPSPKSVTNPRLRASRNETAKCARDYDRSVDRSRKSRRFSRRCEAAMGTCFSGFYASGGGID